MRFLPLAVALVSVTVNASHDIPAVDKLVSSVMSSLAAYTELAAPTGTPAATVATDHNSTLKGVKGFKLVEAVDASYWLESIAHQGVAAFNGDSSYTVFRNVKDYGAKGVSCNPHPSFAQVTKRYPRRRRYG